MAIIKKKVGGKEIDWDTKLGGAVVPYVNHRADTSADKPAHKPPAKAKTVEAPVNIEQPKND